MSHKPTPYSPNFPPSQGYAVAGEGSGENKNSYPMMPQTGYPGPPPMPMPQPGPVLPPGAQPLPGMQPGFQPEYHAPYPHGMQPGFVPGYSHPQASSPAPIMQQPAWMNTTNTGPINCPRGLEYLTTIDKLLVQHQIDLMEVFSGFEANNKYIIKNSLGQTVFFAAEDTDCCTRNLCGDMRPFSMNIMDNYGHEVINLRRPFRCGCGCCCSCCLQKIEINAPPGTVVGTVEQVWSLFKPEFVIKDAIGDVVLTIKGPFCLTCCRDIDFKVCSRDGETKVGKITKKWTGLAREVFTDADYFGISFPLDLDVKMKAVMLGACFLIDFMYYEDKQR